MAGEGITQSGERQLMMTVVALILITICGLVSYLAIRVTDEHKVYCDWCGRYCGKHYAITLHGGLCYHCLEKGKILEGGG